jgi:hypothetical protein
MMKLTATAALGALILAASAAPAFAAGYWDGGIVQSGQGSDAQPSYSDRDCPCYCPSDRQSQGRDWREEQRWSDRDRYQGDDRESGDERYSSNERVYDSGWQDQGAYQDQQDDQDQDYAPAEYSDSGYGVGPDGYYDEAGGGSAGAIAGADGFANVGIDVDINDRFRDRDHFHDQERFHDHDMMHHDDHQHMMMHHQDHPYPQHQSYQPHMGQWGSPMQPYHQMQPHYGMAPRMSGYSHPMAMHRSGGGGRRR